MTSVLILSFIAAFLVANGVAHYISGINGQAFPMGFGSMKSPTASIVWGIVEGIVATIVWHLAPMRFHARAASLGIVVGLLVSGLWMANTMRAKSHHAHKDNV
jgi:hypothetical protein